MTSLKHNTAFLFISTFVSAFLFVFGTGTLLLMFAPVFAEVLTPTPVVWPQLPVAEDRNEPFLDLASIPAKQPYPALSSVSLENVEAGNWIRIPSIGVNVPLANSPSINDVDVIKTLDRGAALYPNGILPGKLGNVFIAAHSTGEPWKGTYRFAFLKLNEVGDGNQIHLDYDNTRYTYTVVKKDIVKPSSDYRVISDRPVPTVTLMACWPLWSTSQRMLTTAELTNITKLTTEPTI